MALRTIVTAIAVTSNPTPTFPTPKHNPPLILETPPHDLFTRMLQAAFMSLNTSRPNLTESCWLCYNAKLPFYEGVGLTTQFSYSKESNPKQCRWDTPCRGITLEMVSGQGTCIGNPQLISQDKQLCNTTVTINKQYLWAIPTTPGIWTCHTTGIPPCIYTSRFNTTNDFCVQVVVIPRILYHPDDQVLCHFEEEPHWQK